VLNAECRIPLQFIDPKELNPRAFHDFGNFALLIPGCNLRVMSHNDGSLEPARPNASQEIAEVYAPSPLNLPVGDGTASGHYTDLQSAPRFPIKLPLFVKSKSGESHTQTENISANGVLFRIDAEVPVGSAVDFTIALPAEVVGTNCDVRVDCHGRVVRSFEDDGRCGVGVVIDEYHFERD
jgi:PilZ domain